MFLSNRGLEPHWLLGCWGNKHQQIKIATKSYAYLSYWRLATGLARQAIPEALYGPPKGGQVFDQCVSSETMQPQEGPTCKAQEKWID